MSPSIQRFLDLATGHRLGFSLLQVCLFLTLDTSLVFLLTQCPTFPTSFRAVSSQIFLVDSRGLNEALPMAWKLTDDGWLLFMPFTIVYMSEKH